MSARILQNWCSLEYERPYRSWVEAGLVCVLQSFSCHLIACDLSVWLFSMTIAACAMILSARILHEKTPDKRTSHPQISADVPVMVSIFSTGLSSSSQHLGKYDGSPCDDDRFLDSNGSNPSYFGANHCRQEPRVFWYEDDLSFLTTIFYLMIPLALLMVGISACTKLLELWWEFAGVGLIKQTAKCRSHWTCRWTMRTATDYNVSNGVTMIRFWLTCERRDYLTRKRSWALDWCSGEPSLKMGWRLETDISNKVLLKMWSRL